jgi:hypothetical protein
LLTRLAGRSTRPSPTPRGRLADSPCRAPTPSG